MPNNYSFVIDSSFQPFTFEDFLKPWNIYSNAYKEVDQAYTDLTDKADTFKYLSRTLPETSKARKIYEGYANDLAKQAKSLEKNGLNIDNRAALTGLRRRYQGEIGRLMKADERLQKEIDLRAQMRAKDGSILYATDNLNIDDYLDENTPNLYSISGNELYAKGAAAGKSASQKVYSYGDAGKTLGGYYRDWVQRNGYSAEDLYRFGNEIMNDFTAQVSVLPELQQAANQILDANGVTANLKGDNLRRARQQVIRGIIEGSVCNESHNPVRDEGVMSASQAASIGMQKRQQDFEIFSSGSWQDNDGNWHYDPEKDLKTKRAIEQAEKVAEARYKGKNAATGSSGSGGSSDGYVNRNEAPVGIGTSGRGYDVAVDKDTKKISVNGTEVNKYDIVDSEDIINDQKAWQQVAKVVGSDWDGYYYIRIPKGTVEDDGSGYIWDSNIDEDIYIAVPKNSKKAAIVGDEMPDDIYS